MYNAGDMTYLTQPKHMSDELVRALLKKVRNHCLRHNLKYFEFIFHGGEPLLLKKEFYTKFVTSANKLLFPEIKPTFSLQTNGILLTEDWCRVLGELNITLGISLDGTAEVNNKSRVDHQGKGSYDAIIRGLKIAQQSTHLKSPPTVLCVIDVSSNPWEVYENFKSLSVKKISFLFPHATYDFLPPRLKTVGVEAPYADWLIAIFDKWFEDDKSKPKIKLFKQVIELVLGIDKGFDYLGKRNLEFLVIETDGSIEAAGALKVCGDGFTKAGMNILHNSLDEALNTELTQLYHLSHKQLPQKCRKCSIVEVCGGGFLPHRYSKKNGFDNPSLFCKDLMKLITHVQNKILNLLPSDIKDEMNITNLLYEEIIDQHKLLNL